MTLIFLISMGVVSVMLAAVDDAIGDFGLKAEKDNRETHYEND